MTSAGSSEAPGKTQPQGGGEGLLGKVLDGRYRIDAVLGKGGVGVVYRAEHTTLGRPVAIKVLHEYFGDRDDLRLRFEREAKVLSALAHPHVVAITDYGIADGMPYLAMELLDGQTLGELLRHRSPLDPDTAVDIARGILRGLAFAHARGVLHRDLKPANVFLQRLPDDPHHVKLLDFGLAKIVEAEDDAVDELTLTRQGTVLGTPAYMSPEQASGATVDERADIYSAGCVLFELLAGRPPYVAEARPDLIRKHMLEDIPEVSEARPGVTPCQELSDLLRRALAKDPRARFADAGEMLAALEALPRPPAWGEGTGRPPTGAKGRARSSSSSYAAAIGAKGAAGAGSEELRSPAGGGHGAAKGRRFGWVGPTLGLLGLAVAAAGALLAWRTAEEGEDLDLEAMEDFEEVGLVAPQGGSTEGQARGPAPDDTASAPTGTEEDEAPEATAEGEVEGEEATASSEEPQEEEAAAGDAPSEEAAPEEGEARPDRDPGRYLLAGTLPRALRPYWARVKRGRPLTRAHHRRLRKYQQRMATDPRPSLLLGHDFHRRDWMSDALTRYESAYRFDETARGDPHMLRNLVDMAGTQAVGGRAADLVVEIYGAEAVQAVDRALSQADDPDRVSRLEGLKRRLVGKAP